MPLYRREPFNSYVSPFHPIIHEQGGFFFFDDGTMVPRSLLEKFLCYNKELCKRFGWKWNGYEFSRQEGAIGLFLKEEV